MEHLYLYLNTLGCILAFFAYSQYSKYRERQVLSRGYHAFEASTDEEISWIEQLASVMGVSLLQDFRIKGLLV